MARYAGGRPGSSRRVRLVPVRRRALDHRAVARIVLALAREMATDEAVESAANGEVVSLGVGACSRSEPATGDTAAATAQSSATPDTTVAPHSGAQRGAPRRAQRTASVGCCAADKSVSASAGSCVAGRCSHQRHTSAHCSARGTPSTTSHALSDRAGASHVVPGRSAASSPDEVTAASSIPGGTP